MAKERTRAATVRLGVAIASPLVGFVGYWITGLAILYEVPCMREHRGCERWELYRIVGPALLLAALVAVVGLLALAFYTWAVAAWRKTRERRESARRPG